MSTENTNAQFGIFVGFYNKINNTSISVKEAAATLEITSIYEKVSVVAKCIPLTVIKKVKSTKSLSYEHFQAQNGTSVAHTIYKHLKTTKGQVSRREIAEALSLRLSTVCGQVNALLGAGVLEVIGAKVDEQSDRSVEVLRAK